jgi:hypothetical protein
MRDWNKSWRNRNRCEWWERRIAAVSLGDVCVNSTRASRSSAVSWFTGTPKPAMARGISPPTSWLKATSLHPTLPAASPSLAISEGYRIVVVRPAACPNFLAMRKSRSARHRPLNSAKNTKGHELCRRESSTNLASTGRVIHSSRSALSARKVSAARTRMRR